MIRDDSLLADLLPLALDAAAHFRQSQCTQIEKATPASFFPLSVWLPARRAQVLHGCRIIFFTDMDSYRNLRESQASPETREHLLQSNQLVRETHAYMLWAERFGAECFYSTTHQMPIFRDSPSSFTASMVSTLDGSLAPTPPPDAYRSMQLSQLGGSPPSPPLSSSAGSSTDLIPLSTVVEVEHDDSDEEEEDCASVASFSSWTTDSMAEVVEPRAQHPLATMTHMVYHSLSQVSVTTEFLQLFQAGTLHLVNDLWIRDTCLYMQRQPEAAYLAHPTHASRLDREIHLQGVHL
jgi:hypothetical protein